MGEPLVSSDVAGIGEKLLQALVRAGRPVSDGARVAVMQRKVEISSFIARGLGTVNLRAMYAEALRLRGPAMRFLLGLSAALALTLVTGHPAHAFTFETPPGTTVEANKSGAASGFTNMDPASALPPIGESVPDMRYDESPGSRNNGWASPPDPRNSVGPRWLYGPAH
jgi:hypothetical protein